MDTTADTVAAPEMEVTHAIAALDLYLARVKQSDRPIAPIANAALQYVALGM
jgi:hypothetical protein